MLNHVHNSDAEQRAAAAEKVQDIDVKRKLLDVTKQLERYQAVFGESTSKQPADVQVLTQQLHAKEDEIQKLKLQDQQREQVRTNVVRNSIALTCVRSGRVFSLYRNRKVIGCLGSIRQTGEEQGFRSF